MTKHFVVVYKLNACIVQAVWVLPLLIFIERKRVTRPSLLTVFHLQPMETYRCLMQPVSDVLNHSCACAICILSLYDYQSLEVLKILITWKPHQNTQMIIIFIVSKLMYYALKVARASAKASVSKQILSALNVLQFTHALYVTPFKYLRALRQNSPYEIYVYF